MINLHPRLLDALREDAQHSPAILMPSGRLLRQLRELCGEKFGVRQEPAFFRLGDWVIEHIRPLLYEQDLVLLPQEAEFLIWQEALEGLPPQARALIAPEFFIDRDAQDRLVQRALEAWRYMHLYRADLDKKNFSVLESRIGKFFYHWGTNYLEVCRQRKLVDRARAEKLFVDSVATGKIVVPPSLWIGFTLPTPSEELLFQTIHKAGGQCAKLDCAFELPQQERRVYEYASDKAELTDIARKVARLHREQPARRIGVVISDLETNWHAIRRVFAEAMRPSDGVFSTELPFDISLGSPHNSYPLIGDLLALLQIGNATAPVEDFLQLFGSPYLSGYQAEQTARSCIDDKLTELSAQHRQLSLSQLAGKGVMSRGDIQVLVDCPLLRKALQRYLAVPDAFKEKLSPMAWAEVFMKQIEALGWGKEINWGSQELQAWEKWLEVLNGLYAIGSVKKVCSREEALLFLCRQTDGVFQPKTRVRKRVHLLGIQPARHLIYDDLFLCRMHEHALKRPMPNFFISYQLARATNIPWASPERRRKEEADVLGQIAYADNIHISYAATTGGEDNNIHPLFEGMKIHSPQIEPRAEFLPQQLERIRDTQAPSIDSVDDLHSGLISLIKEQSACPFRSFAMLRLGIKTPASFVKVAEITPLQRGMLLHALLSDLWRELGDLGSLQKISEEALLQNIDRAVDELLRKHMRHMIFLKKDEMLRAAERRLLREMAATLFLWEKRNRRRLFRADQLEHKASLGAEELPSLKALAPTAKEHFNLRVDRIDAFEAGKLVIDYKTSKNISSKDLIGDRPREPQLAIYSLTHQDIKGLGFISFSLKEGVKLDGFAMFDNELFPLSDNKETTDEINETLRVQFPKKSCALSAEQLAEMQEAVNRLLSEHLSGEAAVDPRDKADCRYCAYSSLCRIGESELIDKKEEQP